MSDEDRDVDIESDEDDDCLDASGGSNNTQFMSQSEKRAHHNALERKRRDHIKESFHSLRDSVPALQGEKTVDENQDAEVGMLDLDQSTPDIEVNTCDISIGSDDSERSAHGFTTSESILDTSLRVHDYLGAPNLDNSVLLQSVKALDKQSTNLHLQVSRAQILKKAADYIQCMRKKNHCHQEDIDDLKKQNSILEQQIRALDKARNTGQFAQTGVVGNKGSLFDEGSESESSDGNVGQSKRKKLKT